MRLRWVGLPALVLLALVGLFLLWGRAAHRGGSAPRRSEAADSRESSRGLVRSVSERPLASEEATRGDSSLPLRRFSGTVFGPEGVLWGARVIALVPGTEQRVAELGSDPDGTFVIEVGGEHDVLDLWVRPSDATGLLGQRRSRCGAGGHERFDLVAGRVQVHRISAKRGSLRSKVTLLVLTRATFDAVLKRAENRAWVHPRRFRAAAVRRANADRSGQFRLTGLAEGEFALVVDSDSWMLEQPCYFTADQAINAGVVPALGIDIAVRCIETGGPIPRFTATLTGVEDPRAPRTLEGNDGALSVRFPCARNVNRHDKLLRIETEGFVPREWNFTRGVFYGENEVWLWPKGEPNVLFRVLYEDDEPFGGVLQGNFRNGSLRERLRLERIDAGRYRGRLPVGDWDVSLGTLPGLFRARHEFPVRIEPGGELDMTFHRERGGTLIVQSAELQLARIRYRREPGDVPQEILRFVKPAELVLEDVPPGEYAVRLSGTTGDDDWFELTAGARRAVRLAGG